MENNILTDDQRETRLWEASYEYVEGKLARERLKDIEQSHTQVLRQAIMDLARGFIKRRRERKQEWADQEEKELWMASWMYMNGKIDVKQLEYVELPHTFCFRKALLAQAKYALKRHVLHLFFIL